MSFTARGMLNLCEKTENAVSTISCVQKLISTRSPRSEYDMPYISLNVRRSNGESVDTVAIDTFEE